MPAYYQITYLPEGRVETYAGSRGNHYELEDGSRLDVETVPVWCRRCSRVSEGEQIETLEDIDQEIAKLHDPTSSKHQMVARGALHQLLGGGDEFLKTQIERLRLRRRWREGRQSPPKCIECGSTDLVQIPHGVPTPHPQGRGTILIQCKGMCSTGFNNWFFTPEGDRIPRDTKPSYWRHPALENTPEELKRFLQGQLDGDETGDD